VAGRDNDVTAWMPLYVRDLLAATEDLGAHDFGGYVRLLCHLWLEHGHLGLDQERLRRLAHVTRRRWPATWAALAKYFLVVDGRVITQRRLLYELEQAHELRRARSRAGKLGAAAKWGGEEPANDAAQDGNATTLPLAKDGTHHTSPSPSPDQTGGDEDISSSSAPKGRAAPATVGSEVIVTFPTVPGRRSGEREWHLTKSAAAELQDGFPDLDVAAEAGKARAWVLTHATKRKTARGMPAFLFGWLSRSQNRGGARTGTAPAAPPSAPRALKGPPPDLCAFHREVTDVASSDPYGWCALCRKFGTRPRRTGTSEPEPIGVGTVPGGGR
jgi:uncharacterized protein YdaU (DUF1376 family)